MADTAQVTVTFLVTLTKTELGLEPDTSKEEFEAAVQEFMKHDFDYNDWTPTDVEVEVE